MKSAVLLLGGGQLGLMMAEAGAQLALHVDRLDLREDLPAHRRFPDAGGAADPEEGDRRVRARRLLHGPSIANAPVAAAVFPLADARLRASSTTLCAPMRVGVHPLVIAARPLPRTPWRVLGRLVL